MSYSCLIVDDEKSGRESLTLLIHKLAPELEVLGTASSVEEGVAQVHALRPDILFLDVNMPTGTGFDVLKKVNHRDFEVIFVTAHDKYAIDAIRESAIDYLLKPINIGALQDAIRRAVSALERKEENSRIDQLIRKVSAPVSQNRLSVPSRDGIEFIPVDQILYFVAEGSYTNLVLRESRNMLASKPIGHFEEQLEGSGFFRIHKSYLISLSAIQRYKHGKGGQVQMEDGNWLDVSRTRKRELLDKFGSE